MSVNAISNNPPILSLRLKPSSLGLVPNNTPLDDTLETLSVMTSQDVAYKCRDYVSRRRKRVEQEFLANECHPHHPMVGGNGGNSGNGGNGNGIQLLPEEIVDEVCREKMCEWSYRVCDHFQTSREIVAFAFSFLDRFIDRCSCDRTAFKLAAMTSLYMATKMLNAKQISIGSLADLSRGEFEVAHISEMERIILETLEWRMNPPTVQSYIALLRQLIEIPNDTTNNNNNGTTTTSTELDDVCDRAIFFAELCVYDYSFVVEEKYLIAVACILNGIESMDQHNMDYILLVKKQFLISIGTKICVELDPMNIEKVQARLWYLYTCSAEVRTAGDILPYHLAHKRLVKYHLIPEPEHTLAYSPVSVNNQF